MLDTQSKILTLSSSQNNFYLPKTIRKREPKILNNLIPVLMFVVPMSCASLISIVYNYLFNMKKIKVVNLMGGYGTLSTELLTKVECSLVCVKGL